MHGAAQLLDFGDQDGVGCLISAPGCFRASLCRALSRPNLGQEAAVYWELELRCALVPLLGLDYPLLFFERVELIADKAFEGPFLSGLEGFAGH